MGGLERLAPTVVPESERVRFTCTTLGCPDAAVVILPLNRHIQEPRAEENTWSDGYLSGVPYLTKRGAPQGERRGLEMRLCYRCIRTLATALPRGMRLPGALLRYANFAPEVLSTEEVETRLGRRAR